MPQAKKTGNYKTSVIYCILIIILSAAFAVIYTYAKSLTKEEQIFNSVQEKILRESDNLESASNKIQQIIGADSNNIWQNLEKFNNESKYQVLIYQNDSLVYWNNNKISDDLINVQLNAVNIIASQSGWYLLASHSFHQFRIIVCERLKSSYDSGEDITHNISGGMVSCRSLNFTHDYTLAKYQLKDRNGKYLAGLNFSGNSFISYRAIFILFIIFLLVYLFILLLISSIYDLLKNGYFNKLVLILSLSADFIIIRILDFAFGFPAIIKQSKIFESQFDILHAFNSSGDLLINGLIALLISIYFFRSNFEFNLRKFSAKISTELIMSIISGIYTIFVLYIVNKVIQQLPYNSFYGISFHSVRTILSLVALLVYLTSLFVFQYAAARFLNRTGRMWYAFLIGLIIAALIIHFMLPVPWILPLISIVFIVITEAIYHYFSGNRKQSFYQYLFLIIIYALISSFVMNRARINKKDAHQLSTIRVIADPHDKTLEDTFRIYQQEVNSDSVAIQLLNDNSTSSKSNLEDYLKQKYFSGLLKKYTIQVTVCRENDMLEIKPEGVVVDCSAYFDDVVNNSDNEEIGGNLFLISEDPESVYYIGSTSFESNNGPVNLYIEFFFTYVPEGLGYPEVLVNKSAVDIDLTDYSFARYVDGQLVNKFGEYKYLTSFESLQHFKKDTLFNLNNYRHIIHQLSANNYLIISRPRDRISVHLVTFSVLFVLYLLTLFIIVVLLFGRQAKNLIRLSFQSRLQVIFLSTISLIILLLTAITLFYINIDNRNRLVYQLNEKTNSLIIELQHKLSDKEDFYQIDPSELEFLLKKFSMVFFTDINIYSPDGELISTSRPEIFDHGLLANRINPEAYDELFLQNQLFFVLQEKLGKTTYFSSYAPIILRGNQTAGIINLPYFAKQSEVNRSYYLMIFTFFDLFVILGIVGTIIAILLSRIITKPLTVLQEKLSGIQIDQRNEIIEWKTKDEIGQLIEAYNNMIVKLEASTELLKQSERESAWREVAQQIAHEIKNPLTPMKLNIQYLEKAFHEKDPELDEKVRNISQILISQIDTLNKVAEMFADFAKTKSGKFEKVDIVKVINECILLYKNHSNVTFDLEADDREFYTRAIEKDLIRMFNNLVKNAIHSIGDKKDGLIRFKVTTVDNFHRVDIIDNGKGIPDRFKANIFQPYFTTKSKGTGLGLAIVKNIMNEIGGQITFESKSEQGTTFTLNFPVVKKSNSLLLTKLFNDQQPDKKARR